MVMLKLNVEIFYSVEEGKDLKEAAKEDEKFINNNAALLQKFIAKKLYKNEICQYVLLHISEDKQPVEILQCNFSIKPGVGMFLICPNCGEESFEDSIIAYKTAARCPKCEVPSNIGSWIVKRSELVKLRVNNWLNDNPEILLRNNVIPGVSYVKCPECKYPKYVADIPVEIFNVYKIAVFIEDSISPFFLTCSRCTKKFLLKDALLPHSDDE